MADSNSTEILTRWVVGLVLTLLGGGGLLGWAKFYREGKRQAADIHLAGAQAEVQLATAEKTRAEGQKLLLDGLLAAAQALASDVARLRADREALLIENEELKRRAERAEAAEKLLEQQNKDLAARLQVKGK
jgi:hypothetical protein